MPKNYPKVTIIICAYNGERGIGDCLAALKQQTYPADRFSVVLIDDGCTDKTVAIAKKYGVRVVSHGRNRGVAFARNSGLKAARTELIVYLDDDCVAVPTWLEGLVAPFADEQVVAVGGRVMAHSRERLSERFMEAIGYGNAEPLVTLPGNYKNPLRRFGVYLKNMYRPARLATEPIEAQAVYTANVAYHTSALRAIGGFDTSLLSNEDSDVATRLREVGGKLMFAPDAAVTHRHHQRVWHVIRQTFYRAGDTYVYYRKNRTTPPLFPFPFLYVLMVGATEDLSWSIGTLVAVTAPVVLYNSWILHAVRARKPEYVLYAYIQMGRELAALLGFACRALALVAQRKTTSGSYALRSAAAAEVAAKPKA